MLLSTNELSGYGLLARDGGIGEVTALLFDDRTFDVRYFACRTMKWLGREVLIAPEAFGDPDWTAHTIPVDLTREQIRESPSIDADAPVSHRQLQKLHAHYGWAGAFGVPAALPPAAVVVAEPAAEQEQDGSTGDEHLRSTKAMRGMSIAATDGSIGHVEDFVVDTDAWRIRYMIIDTRNWLPGRKVFAFPDDITGIDWAGREVEVGLTRSQIEGGAEFDPSLPINREVETRLLDFYGRPHYWEN